MKDRVFGVRFFGTMVFLSLTPGLAWSYIDPGNGAYMVQVLFTLAGAVLFYIRHPVRFFHAIQNWIVRRRSSGSGSPDAGTSLDSAPTEKMPGRSD